MKPLAEILSSRDLRDLADIGFIAASRGMAKQAAEIFLALRMMRPSQDAGIVGGAIVSLLEGKSAQAVRMLENSPATVATRTFLGLALLEKGDHSRGQHVLQSIVQAAPNSSYAQLASDLIASRPVAPISSISADGLPSNFFES